MNFLNYPPLSDTTLYTYTFYTFLAIFAFKSESSGNFNLPYSKFASNKGMDPRIGMFIIYFLPILAYFYTWNLPNNPKTSYQYLTLGMFLIHFGKRCLEVLFLHKFSSKIGFIGIFFITLAYSNIGLLTGSLHNQTPPDVITKIPVWWTLFGILLFMGGELGNLYHHFLLTKLREDKGDKSYKIPTKGMFPNLVCPHYFFELISWLGFAVVSTYFDTYFLFLIMTAYLAGRSHTTREWYLKKIPNFPVSRKRILPGIY